MQNKSKILVSKNILLTLLLEVNSENTFTREDPRTLLFYAGIILTSSLIRNLRS